jgi:hypothetical protein
MKQIVLKTLAVTSTFACATLLSFSWSGQDGVSLSVESAQARVGRPLTPVSVAGVARRQNRRAAYRYDAAGIAGPMAVDYAGIAAASAGTAAAVGAATSPGWGWGGNPYYAGGPYAGGPYGWGGQGPGPYTQLHGRAVGPAGPALSSGQWLAGVGRPIGSWNNSWGASAYYAPPAAPTANAPAWNIFTAYHDNGPFYGYSGWSDYKARGGIGCDPGTVYKTENGVHYICQ